MEDSQPDRNLAIITTNYCEAMNSMIRLWKSLRWIVLGVTVASALILLQELHPFNKTQSAQVPIIMPSSATKINDGSEIAFSSKIARSNPNELNAGLSTPSTKQETQIPAKSSVSAKDSNPPLDKSVELGHFPYAEAEQKKLMIISSYAQAPYQRYERLHADAALALMKLIYTARDEGVWIIPVSGFRSIAIQEKLFQSQIEKTGSETAAARISAPPGHSEHHTGYAIDLADGSNPNQDITQYFQQTRAFRWLTQHAKEFGFEMSFPLSNSQGVSYEPWHWRFVGSSQARTVFARAKQAL